MHHDQYRLLAGYLSPTKRDKHVFNALVFHYTGWGRPFFHAVDTAACRMDSVSHKVI
jgi:hypothetical protein